MHASVNPPVCTANHQRSTPASTATCMPDISTSDRTAPDSSPTIVRQVFGALALELSADSDNRSVALPHAQAGLLGERIAHDLAGFAPDASHLQLATVGAHYDAVELLRPGWPLHRELVQLAARAPGDRGDAGGRIVAFGAHDGQLPDALVPAEEYLGGPLRLLPFVLDGDEDTVASVDASFEHELMDRGMAGAETALMAQEVFGLRLDHARYLTLHDLAAMMAVQYDYAGLAALWPVIETALLEPRQEQWLDATPEPLVHYVDGEARIALFTPEAWRVRYAGDADGADGKRLERRFEQFQGRQRQFAAVLGAHGIGVNFVHCDAHHDSDL